MAEVFSREKRSEVMRAIRSANTKPEIIVGRFLFAKGFRFRLQAKQMHGTLDIILKKYRAAIFVNGCFWHGYACCRYTKLPKSNREYWVPKIERNILIDRENVKKIQQEGWKVFIVWECDLKPKKRPETLEILSAKLSKLLIKLD